MRIAPLDPIVSSEAQRIAAGVLGTSAAWSDGALRFRPRDTDQLNQLVDAMRAIPVPIVSLEPIRLSLEQFFIQVVGEKEA